MYIFLVHTFLEEGRKKNCGNFFWALKSLKKKFSMIFSHGLLFLLPYALTPTC